MEKYILNKILGLLLIIGLLGVTSCDDDDFTGYSTITPASVTVSISPDFGNSITLIEDGSKHEVTVSLSEVQVADVKLNISKIEGTATAVDDYVVPSEIVVAAGSTSATFTINIVQDDIIEPTETLKLQIGDAQTANATITPIIVEITIQNYTEPDLGVNYSWATNVESAIGLNLDPTEVVDLRLLLVDDGDNIVDVADGGSFEDLKLSGADLADGTYRLATDIYSTIDAGDFNALVDIDLNLHFVQTGVLDTLIALPAGMNNLYDCSDYRVYMAKVVKSGSTYTIEEDYELPSVKNWYGIDTEFEYESQVTALLACNKGLIYGLNHGWMLDFWGEEVIVEGDVSFTIDAETGSITIPKQYCFTTLYDGAEYPYEISGTGTYDDSGEYPVMTITYVLDQEGFDPSGWCFDNGYMANADFTAVITLDPNGLPPVGKAITSGMSKTKKDFKKPY